MNGFVPRHQMVFWIVGGALVFHLALGWRVWPLVLGAMLSSVMSEWTRRRLEKLRREHEASVERWKRP